MKNGTGICIIIVGLIAGASTLAAQNWPIFLHEDFQINDNIGSCIQDQAAIAKLANGGSVAAWRDYRNGTADIYAQKFNKDGSRNGGNVHVDRAAPGMSCSNPDVIGDPNGGFTIIWEQPGENVYNIMCRRFDQYGSPISAPFALKVDSQASGEKLPAIAGDQHGGFIVVWQDKRNDSGDIYCQRYDSTTAPIRDNFVVNDDNVGEGTQSFPAIATDADGGFIIVWQDNRAGFQNRIFAQRYDNSGRSIGFNFSVDEDLSGPEQWSPAVSIAASGDYVIVWKNGAQENLDIWGKRYKADNSPVGGYFYVTQDSSGARQFNPSVAHDESGAFVVVWQDDRNGQNDIFFRAYQADGGAMNQPRRIDDNLHAAHHFAPQAVSVGSNDFLIAWDDRRSGLGDIMAQQINIEGKKRGFNFKINDDVGSSFQEHPAIVRTRRGEYFIAWTDYRHGGQDIYAQKIDSLGAAADGNIRISKQHGLPGQSVAPALAAGPHNITCAWNQKDDVGWNVMLQSWDFNNEFLTASDTLIGFSAAAQQTNPHLAYFADGSLVLVWAENKGDQSSGEWDIYAQRLDADRLPLDAPLLVNFDNRDGRQDFPFVAAGRNGGFVVSYIDFSGGLMAQRFDAAGRPLGTNFKVDAGGYIADRVQAPVVFDSMGGFIVVWSGAGKTSQGVFFKQYSDEGVPFRGVTTVDSIFANAAVELKNPAVAIDDDNNFSIAWQRSDKSRAASSIFAAYFNSNGESSFPIFSVHRPSASFASQPSIALFDGRLFTAWRDNRMPGQGFDIWASLLELRPATGIVTNEAQPDEFVLQQNYPNPFNSASVIQFRLPAFDFVNAAVYDVRGRQIKRLYRGQLESGAHSLAWDGRDDAGTAAASGVYFCRVQFGDQSRTIKMALMR